VGRSFAGVADRLRRAGSQARAKVAGSTPLDFRDDARAKAARN